MTNIIQGNSYFGSSVYTVDMPEFLGVASTVAKEFLQNNPAEISELYPVKMSGNMFMDERLMGFCQFTADSARKILDNQGYAINLFNMYFSDMWTQEHHKSSGMEQHIHGAGIQMVGFYFLEVPKNSSRVLFHDPNPAKVISGLPEKDVTQVTPASTLINYEPKAGQFIFTNAWLPHSFTKNPSDEPLKFIHFNLGVELILQNNQQPTVEVI